jgi:transcriptional regulator with XRE-family HTH domain
MIRDTLGGQCPVKNLSDLIASRRPEAPSIIEFPLEVGKRLRLQRMAFLWRQADLAKRAGVSVQTVKSAEKGETISSESLLRLLLALSQGADFLKMLEAPNFPNLKAHEHFIQLMTAPGRSLGGRRVRTKTVTTTKTPGKS